MSKAIGRERRRMKHGLAVHAVAALLSAHGLTALVAGVTALGTGVVHAVTLPPPPVSPAPVTDYEYDAKGNLTKVIKAKGVAGFGLTTQNAYDALDRVKTSTDAKSGVTGLGYDGRDNLS